MNRHPPEPLTQEERELAQLIARVGSHNEPPAALDAKILAAAHAAVNSNPQRARKPRWPVAMGLAASVVFAVGIAWQLRPLQPAAPLSSEAPVPASAAPEMAARTEAEPVTAAAAATPVDAVAQDSAAAGAASASASADVSMSAPPPPPPAAKVLPSRTLSMPPPRRAARIPPPPEAPPVPRQAQEGDRYHSPNAPPAPPAPAAPVMAASAPAAEAPSAFTAESRAGAVAEGLSANEAADYSAARTAATKQSAAREEPKASATIREQERGVQESAARDRATLDRVEVTGSRLQHTDRQVPVSDDARLPVDEWLERVRTRYGLGDADAAKRSLLLFVHEHPGETVPSDLEPLLEK